MVSASLLLAICQAQTFVCNGRLHEIDADGEEWIYFLKCVKCGKLFAEPDSGLVCCVCLASKAAYKVGSTAQETAQLARK
jgi:hypothetical protein